jgi:hypothetical protein
MNRLSVQDRPARKPLWSYCFPPMSAL